MLLTNMRTYNRLTIGLISIVFGLGFLLLTTAIPVAMIAIGATHINDCPHSTEIPILLIVAGAILGTGSLINIGDQLMEGYAHHNNGKRKSVWIRAINCLVIGLLVACLILGCIWIHGRNVPHENRFFDDNGANSVQPALLRNQTVTSDSANANRADPQYCHPLVYQFSYWLLNISFVIMGLILILTLIGILTANIVQ